MSSRFTIFEYLKIDVIQRLVYLGILLLWLFIGINFVAYKSYYSPFRIDVFYALVIPPSLLIIQIIFNKQIIWICNFVIALIHALWTTHKIVFDYLIFFERDYLPSMKGKLIEMKVSIPLILISFLITWVIWKMKPLHKKM